MITKQENKKKFNLFLSILEILDVGYERLNDFEIIINAPADFISRKLWITKNFQLTCIHDKNTTCITDNARISVMMDENGELNWLIEIQDTRKA